MFLIIICVKLLKYRMINKSDKLHSKTTCFFKAQGEFIVTSLWPFSAQLNQRMKEGRIQGEDQEKGQMSGQSMSGSAKERSENLCGKARRYQGNWMGISMIRFQRTGETDG